MMVFVDQVMLTTRVGNKVFVGCKKAVAVVAKTMQISKLIVTRGFGFKMLAIALYLSSSWYDQNAGKSNFSLR